jgi:poly(3-hydroxybutyrate) depolymerase
MRGTKVTNLRRITLTVIASLAGLVFAAAAAANVTSNSNAAVTMSVSLMNGSNGASATAGNAVSASASVTNLVDGSAYVRIYVIADWDHGWSPSINKLKKMKDGDTWDISGTFKVGTFTPPGVYQLRILADTPGNPLLEADASMLVL